MRVRSSIVLLTLLVVAGASLVVNRFIATDDFFRLGGSVGARSPSVAARGGDASTDASANPRELEESDAITASTRPTTTRQSLFGVECGLAVHVVDPNGAPLPGIDVVVDGLISKGAGWIAKPIARLRTKTGGVADVPLEVGLERQFHVLRIRVDVAAMRAPEILVDLPLESGRRVEFELSAYAWLDVVVEGPSDDLGPRAAIFVVEMSDGSKVQERVATFEIEFGKTTSIPVETGIGIGTHLEYLGDAIDTDESAESITLTQPGERRAVLFRIGDHFDFVTLRVVPPEDLSVPRIAVFSASSGDDELPQEVALTCPVGAGGLVRIGIPKRLRTYEGAWELVVRPDPWRVESLDVDLQLVGRLAWVPAYFGAKTPVEVRLEPWDPYIRRTIVDADGAPIPDAVASVAIDEADQLPWGERVTRSVARTGRSGRVLLARSDDYGNLRTYVYSAKGFRSQGEIVDETSPSDSRIVLPRGRSLTVRPLLDEGCRLGDLEARFFAEDGSSPGGGASPGRDFDREAWCWPDQPPGAGRIVVKASWGANDDVGDRTLLERRIEADAFSADRTIDLDLRGLIPLVRVQIVDEMERPIPHASFSRATGGEGPCVSGLDGTLTLIADRTLGTCSFGAEGFRTLTVEGPIRDGTIMLRPGLSMTLRVRKPTQASSSSSVTDATRIVVGIARMDQGYWIAKADLRPDGTATFVMPGPGRYRAAWLPYSSWIDEQPASTFSSSRWSAVFDFREGGQVVEIDLE